MTSGPRWAFIHPFQLRLQRGIEVYLWNLGSALAEIGVQVDILTWQGPLARPAHVVGAPLRVRAVPAVRYYQAALAVPYYVAALATGHYDHVFAHFAGYGEGAALDLARMAAPVPFSLVCHFPRSLVPQRYTEYERYRWQERVQHIVAVSRYVASEAEAWAGRACGVIGHGVDTAHFAPDVEQRRRTRTALGLTSADRVLVTTAALEERKGVQWVIRALPKVLRAHPNTYYLVLGEGPYRAALEGIVARQGLGNHVRLLGAVPDPQIYLCASDVGLLLSRGEALPVSVLEYAATGLPILTSDRPPFDEMVGAAWGSRVAEQDAEQVADAIGCLLADPEALTRKGVAARAAMVESHTWQGVARQYRELVG